MGRFDKIKQGPCQALFERFWRCLDMNNQNYLYCREEEQAFHACAQEHLVAPARRPGLIVV